MSATPQVRLPPIPDAKLRSDAAKLKLAPPPPARPHGRTKAAPVAPPMPGGEASKPKRQSLTQAKRAAKAIRPNSAANPAATSAKAATSLASPTPVPAGPSSALPADEPLLHISATWRRPDMRAALRHRDGHHPRNVSSMGRLSSMSVWETRVGRHCCRQLACVDPCCEGEPSELGKFGPVPSLFFKFEKWLLWTFFCVALLNTPSLLIYSSSASTAVGRGDSQGAGAQAIYRNLAGATLGRFDPTDGVVQAPLVGILPTASASLLITTLDVLSMVVLAGSLAWLWERERSESAILHGECPTVANFSVLIPWLPASVTSEQLRDFLRVRSDVHPVSIWLAYNFRNLRAAARSQRDAVDEIDSVNGKLWSLCAPEVAQHERSRASDPGAAPARRRGSTLKLAPMGFKPSEATSTPRRSSAEPIPAAGRRPPAGSRRPSSSREHSALTVLTPGDAKGLRPNRGSNDLLRGTLVARGTGPESRRGSSSAVLLAHPFAVQGPPPAAALATLDLASKNLAQRLVARGQRCLSANASFQASALQRSSFGPPKAAIVTFDTRRAARQVLGDLPRNRAEAYARALFEPSDHRLEGKYVLRSEVPPRPSAVRWHMLHTSRYRLCWWRTATCAAASAMMIAVGAVMLVLRQSFPPGLCAPWEPAASPNATLGSNGASDELLGSDWALAIAPFVVGIGNALLGFAIRWLANLEPYHSRTELELAVVTRLVPWFFVCSVALVAIACTSNEVMAVIGLGSVWPAGGFSSFDRNWYQSAGGIVTTYLLLETALPWLQPGVLAAWQWLRRELHARGHWPLNTQRELNRFMVGPDMDFANRYARLVNIAVVALTFSAGMPLLLWIATACFAAAVWGDKALFLRFWRQPDEQDAHLSVRASKNVAIGLFTHAWGAVFMFGAGDLRSQTEYDSRKWLKDAFGLQLGHSGLAFRTLSPMVGDHMWAPLVVALFATLVGVLFLGRGVTSFVSGVACPGNVIDDGLVEDAAAMRNRQRVVAVDAVASRRVELLRTGSLRELEEAGLVHDLASYDVSLHPDFKQLSDEEAAALAAEPRLISGG